jgi:capsular exopolysaccharide synthesis family protein
MSRIFDALQRSGVEQTGVEYPDMVSVATRVFEKSDEGQAVAVTEEEGVSISPGEFPSVEVSVSAATRLVFITEPDSLAAEKFRFLGVRMRQLQQTRQIKKVLVTSTIAEEGKSLVSANLAGVLARRKKQRVLLIEGDLRRPVLARRFGLHSLDGIAEWLQSDSQVVENIYRLEEPGFWLMPAGHPPANTLELMQSGRLSALMEQLATMFDWIIVDSPPLLPLADTTVWSRYTDGALLVVREGTTEKAPLQRGLEILKKADLLGVVLNASSEGNHRNYYQRYVPVANVNP